MSLLAIVLTLIAIGVLLWLVNTYGKQVIDPKILSIINIVVTILTVLWLLKVFGVWAYISQIKV